ncbi:unnamed protein product [Coffea canephora]|uniref:Glycosyltransferase family 92 protein n=1 Tax=Coffea canephora TaxID=49390 RepID=A0A068UIR9_COFCA|nr:unnamed protein product [Coffea canephora]
MVGATALVGGLSSLKDRKKHSCLWLPRNSFFFFSLVLVFLSGFTFFHFFSLKRDEYFRPKLKSTLHIFPMEAVSGESSPATPAIRIQSTVALPDQVLVFLKYPPSTPLFAKDDIRCIYLSSPNSTNNHHHHDQLELFPESVEDEHLDRQIVRCPHVPRGLVVSVSFKANGNFPIGPVYRWDSLAYEAMIDRDNTTVVFVKGFNLRSGRVYDPSKFKCVYGWDLSRPKSTLLSDAVSVAQEIVRCKTPRSILNGSHKNWHGNVSIKVSVRQVGRRKMLNSIARPETRLKPGPKVQKRHQMCICTMLRNQARFLREWVMYHAHIGVEHWFIYDNNSVDDIKDVIQSLIDDNYNVSRHVWPWIKSQEAGFAHCALRARDSCEWVGFIDVDEFFHLPSGLSLHDVLKNQAKSKEIVELRAACHNFGPSGLRKVPMEGVTVGYTCRMKSPERHKSIVKPEALNDTLINMVHHFHLNAGLRPANLAKNMLVINHYKYQVWEVFKQKFDMRVATYVSDWKQKRNGQSKDRTPGLGTSTVEPPDWTSRFCQVKDTGLRDRIIKTFADPRTGRLPWQKNIS